MREVFFPCFIIILGWLRFWLLSVLAEFFALTPVLVLRSEIPRAALSSWSHRSTVLSLLGGCSNQYFKLLIGSWGVGSGIYYSNRTQDPDIKWEHSRWKTEIGNEAAASKTFSYIIKIGTPDSDATRQDCISHNATKNRFGSIRMMKLEQRSKEMQLYTTGHSTSLAGIKLSSRSART